MSAKKFSFFSWRYKSSNWLSINCTKQKTVPLEISTVLVLPAQEYTSLNNLFQPHATYLNPLYPVYSLIHLFPDNSTLHPVHHHRNNHTLNPSTCFLDTLYFLFNSVIASATETFLTKTSLTLWRHSASNGMLSILKLDSILLTLLSTVIHVSFLLSLS